MKVKFDALILMVVITPFNPGQYQNRFNKGKPILMIHSKRGKINPKNG